MRFEDCSWSIVLMPNPSSVCWHHHTNIKTQTFFSLSLLSHIPLLGFSLVILIPISHAVFCLLVLSFSLYFTPPLLINYVCHFCQAEGCIAALLKLLSLSLSLRLALSLALALSTQDRVCSLRAHCSSARTQRAPSSTPPATIVTRPWPWATACPHHNLSSLSPLRAPAGSPEEPCTATTRWALLLSSFSLSLVIHPSFSFVFSPRCCCGAYAFLLLFFWDCHETISRAPAGIMFQAAA